MKHYFNKNNFKIQSLLFNKQIIFIVLILFLFSCANRVTPSGGIKDIIPPKIISSSPENYSINFNKKEIEIEFDEYVQLNDLSKQLIISPLIDPLPEITTSRRTLKIKFDTLLTENTTYTFNFGRAIADVHERNVFENFLFVFSTGHYLDSLSVSGKVINAANLTVEKGILVMLYKNTYDSVPFKKLPDYFAKTDSFGNYKIKNICSGIFKIFSLKDKNNNYLFDQPDEAIGFSDSLILMGDSSKTDLKMFVNQPAKIRLKNFSVEEQGKLKLVFNSRADRVKLQTISHPENPWLSEEYSLNRDTFTLWMNDTLLDSLKIKLLQNDQPFDTAFLALKKRPGGKWAGIKVKTFLINSNAIGGILDAGKELIISFSHPVVTIDENKIIFTKDSVVMQEIKYIFADSIKRNLLAKYNWKENENYEITFLPGAFKDIFNIDNDTVKISFHLKSLKEFGSVLLKLKADEKNQNYIVQLVNDKDAVIREKIIASSAETNFIPVDSFGEFLNPGSYRFKIIYDINKNDRWDTGDYLNKIQPEKVIYYKENITIRANWDLEQEWDLKK